MFRGQGSHKISDHFVMKAIFTVGELYGRCPATLAYKTETYEIYSMGSVAKYTKICISKLIVQQEYHVLYPSFIECVNRGAVICPILVRGNNHSI